MNPLNPYIKIQILICYRSSGENLLKHQLDSSYAIMSSILMITVFYKAVISKGEIWRWSLLGLKGLILLEYQTELVLPIDFLLYNLLSENS